ncbi:sensor histidine kinase, partial [Nostoc sp. NIES-2111]
SVPIATINAPVRAELLRFGAFTIVFLMILAAIVYWLNRFITGRLSEVVEDARQALSGQLRMIGSTGIRELDDLRHSLTRADIYRSVILEQVEQRTAELKRAQAQLTQFAQQLDDNIERERLRISREVHDQIGAIFTGVSMLIGGLPKGAMSEEQRSSVNEALDFGVATARRITAELRPPLLDHLGLAAAVEDMARQVLAPGGIDVRIEVSDAHRLTSRQAIGCYRIMQEAITNALRHSHCKRFEVTGTAEEVLYTFVIEDDGQGLKAGSDAPGHFGMTGMQERARMMGGELQVTSQPGEGVRIRVTVPLDSATDE